MWSGMGVIMCRNDEMVFGNGVIVCGTVGMWSGMGE